MKSINITGFTLIELMIVVSIIGILASIALPAYSDYTARAQIAESMTIVSELKQSVSEFYKSRGTFPRDNQEAAIPEKHFLQGNYVSQVELKDGAFHVTLGNKVNKLAAGKIMTIRPITVKGSPSSPFSWVCGGSEPPASMQAHGENRTNIKASHLPAVCRF